MSPKKMPMETELKLILPGREAETRVISFLRERGYGVEVSDPVKNLDLYLDTYDWGLRKHRLTLRYRLANGKARYTLKSLGGIEKGMAVRNEWEFPLSAPASAPAMVSAKEIRKRVEELIFPRKLVERILVTTHRRPYRVVSPEGAEIELVFDESGFSPRGLDRYRRAQKLHEMEAELLQGPAESLESLASLLQDSFAYLPSSRSKFEVACERLKMFLPAKKPPEKLRIRPEDRMDRALQKILAHQFQRFRDQLPGVRQDIDSEFVHQARVATRRMRSALRLFREAVSPPAAAILEEDLKRLAGLFGKVRDLDVFLLNLSRFRKSVLFFPRKKMRSFEHWMERHRRAPLKALWDALEAPSCRAFERRLIRFLQRPLPLRPRAPWAGKPVAEIAPGIISGLLDAVLQQGQAVLARPKLKEFHRLRIEMKKLRYALEFMAPAYGDSLNSFIEGMVEIQDCLGELQDTVFSRDFIKFLFDEWKGKMVDPALVFILGEIYQLQIETARARREAFGKIWERFSSSESTGRLKEVLRAPTGGSRNEGPES
jgi:CHAD domain-containing protein